MVVDVVRRLVEHRLPKLVVAVRSRLHRPGAHRPLPGDVASDSPYRAADIMVRELVADDRAPAGGTEFDVRVFRHTQWQRNYIGVNRE